MITRLLLLIVLLLAAGPAATHPHAWIEVRSAVILGPDGRVVAIDQEWLFDDFYTVYITEQLPKSRRAEKAALLEIAKENLVNLKEYSYFTDVRVDGKRVDHGTVTEFDSELREGRLWMRLVMPLAAPVDPRRHQVAYAIFDVTYYIEMLHARGHVVAIRGPGGAACRASIEHPKPSTQDAARAGALDRNAPADATLGRLFAEYVAITCD